MADATLFCYTVYMSDYKGLNKILKSESLKILQEENLFQDWKWIFSYVNKNRALVILYTVIGLLASSLSVFTAYLAKQLINLVVAKDLGNVWTLGITFLVCLICAPAARALAYRLSRKISINVNNSIQSEILSKVLDARWIDVSKYTVGDLLNRTNDDVKTIATNAVNWIPNIIINIYTFTLTFVILWKMDYVMALISVAVAPFFLFFSRYLVRKLRSYRKEVSELNSNIVSFETEAFGNFEMIKSFGVNDFFSKKYDEWHDDFQNANLEYNKFEIKARLSMSIMTAIVTILTFGYCLFSLSKGALLYGDMTFFLTQRSTVSNRFNNIVSAFPGIINSAVSAKRIRELVDLKPEAHNEKSSPIFLSQRGGGISVELDDINFAYDGGAEIYKGGHFEAHPGEIVSILGESGIGKTTLIRIILGLVQPSEGSARYIDQDGNSVDINADVRKLVAYVPQGSATILGTIAENMRMVKEDASDEEIIEALKLACAWDFVSKLPSGINSRLGDRNLGISAGQAQRISIARALLKGSPILILDEATSALDIDTEAKVLSNIIKTCPNKACIVSTHRPSILEQSTRIYSIKNKTLTEIER